VSLYLTEDEKGLIKGEKGEASKFAMSVVVRMADILEASELLSIEGAHIDGCGLMSDTGLELAEKLAELGGKVVVPTTLNMIPLDLQNWRKLGVPENFGKRAERLADAYLKMDCIPTWTCAPYQVYSPPRFGQQIAWGESNAIVYANSVLGARTERYADGFDICAALTGKVPNIGLHIKENRRGQILFHLTGFNSEAFKDEVFYPALGYFIGKISQDKIPVIKGLNAKVSSDQFKALGAASASSGAVGLFHVIGLTPEANTLEEAFQNHKPEQVIEITPIDIENIIRELSTFKGNEIHIDSVVLGCPHFSFEEFRHLAKIIRSFGGEKKNSKVRFIIETNHISYTLLKRCNDLHTIVDFGAEIIFDTCIFHSPILSPETRVIMTNSGKCSYYSPGELGVEVVFGDMENCVKSAIKAKFHREPYLWKSV